MTRTVGLVQLDSRQLSSDSSRRHHRRVWRGFRQVTTACSSSVKSPAALPRAWAPQSRRRPVEVSHRFAKSHQLHYPVLETQGKASLADKLRGWILTVAFGDDKTGLLLRPPPGYPHAGNFGDSLNRLAADSEAVRPSASLLEAQLDHIPGVHPMEALNGSAGHDIPGTTSFAAPRFISVATKTSFESVGSKLCLHHICCHQRKRRVCIEKELKPGFLCRLGVQQHPGQRPCRRCQQSTSWLLAPSWRGATSTNRDLRW